VLTWLAWLTICPALGFPTLGTAAMVNRAIFGTIDPGTAAVRIGARPGS
jgi:hypothetical protein